MIRETKQASGTGVVSVHEIYTLGELKSRLGLGDWALRKAKREGLKTARIGSRVFVTGESVLEYLKRQNPQADGEPRGAPNH